ncbi:MAG: endo alpha-1,4 polygalactosaminidase [Streptosporangiaceae bacterium]
MIRILLVLILLFCGCGVRDSQQKRPPRPAPRPAVAARWVPAQGVAWQWQLNVPVDLGVDVPVYDIDGFENGPQVVRRLHDQGRRVICYISAGSAEEFRPDYQSFPAEVLGRPNGWAGERWLDVRRLDVLKPIMAKRFDLCRDRGFDAVEPDLLDAYTNKTGFPLTAADQLAYNRMIAALVHHRGMSVGLKNDLEQIPELVSLFDFAVNEECARFSECGLLKPFVRAGKAVFHVEYDRLACGIDGFSSMRKRLKLGAWRAPCP